MDNTHDTASARPAPEHFSYTITPRAERVGGWRLQLFEGGLEVGGGTYPVTEDVARDDAHAEAVEDGEAWLASRGAAPAFSQSPAPIPEQVAQRSGIEGLNIGRIIELWDANTDRDFGILIEPFARAIEREVLATQSAKQGAQPSMSQRQSFEHWFSDEGKHPRAVERSGDGYVLLSAQSAWEAWKAAYKALDVTGRPSGAPTAGIQASVEQATGAKEGAQLPPITPKHIEEISDILLWPVTEDDARTARDMLQSLHFDLSMAEPVGAPASLEEVRNQAPNMDAAQLAELILADPDGGYMRISSELESCTDGSMRFTVTNPDTGRRFGIHIGLTELLEGERIDRASTAGAEGADHA